MNKKLIAILTLVMFAITLLPMGAFAASKNSTSGFMPTVTETGTATLASIRISQDGVSGNYSAGAFTIDLPSGVEWADNAEAKMLDALSAPATGTVVKSGSRTMTFNLASVNTAGTGELVLPIITKVTSVGTGDIAVTITDVTTGITSGDIVVGRFTSGSASIKSLGKKVTGNSTETLSTIRITENANKALKKDDTIELTLPNKIKWDTSVTANLIVGESGSEFTPSFPTERKMVLKLTTPSSVISVFDIIPKVIIDSEAKYGDIEVTVGGSANINESSIIIGKYADFSVSISSTDAKDIYAGKAEQEAANIIIEEGLKGSILANRDIAITLPTGVKFASDASGLIKPTINNVKGSDFAKLVSTPINSDRDKLTIQFATLSSVASKFEVKNIKLDVAANFTGEVVAKISGPAGVVGNVVLANVKKPVILETESVSKIKMGVQSQKLSDLHITELVKEALIYNKDIVLTLPAGATWSKLPTIEVVEGNLELGTASKSGEILTIPVDAESTTLSKVKISGIEITTDRTIAEGDVEVKLTGSAVVETYFKNKNTAATVKVATVTTPAEDGVVQPVVMTVGSTVYTIDGVEMTMDVAPYIKDARTYFPVRHVAQALGITSDNVVWDNNQRTVTIFRGNRIVQVTIGSRTMLVNGVPLTMDVAPEITADRTMLPIRFVAQGLGVNVDWDDATRTVTLN